MTILIVDDESSYRFLLADYLGNQKWTVLSAADGSEGLEVLQRTEGIDMVISDVYMPIMDGLKFYKKLREIPRFKQLPFLFLSAYDDEFTVSAVKACRSVGFMRKGRPMEELNNWIRFLMTPIEQRGGFFPNDQALLREDTTLSIDVMATGNPALIKNSPRGPHVLIVDDDEALLSTLEKFLTDKGFSVRTLTDAEEAIMAVQCTKFNVVILDIRMPNVDGITALKLIKEFSPKTKVIMLTAYLEPHIVTESQKNGAEEIIAKQSMDRDLPEALTRVFSTQRINCFN
jgi:CheY-like chemotaxis protein